MAEKGANDNWSAANLGFEAKLRAANALRSGIFDTQVMRGPGVV